MKKISEINSEISNILKTAEKYGSNYSGTKEGKRAGKELKKLTLYKYFLETNPSESDLKNTLDKIERLKDSTLSQFNGWIQGNPEKSNLKNPRSAFKNEMGIKKMEEQIKSIKFLLAV
jgi:hypothetical protein